MVAMILNSLLPSEKALLVEEPSTRDMSGSEPSAHFVHRGDDIVLHSHPDKMEMSGHTGKDGKEGSVATV